MRVLPLRKRRWVLLVVAPVVAVVIVAVLAAVRLWWFRPAPRFGPAYFERIKEGMTEDEVEAVVGCPAGYYNKPPPRPAGLPPDASLPTGDIAGRELKHSGPELGPGQASKTEWWWGDSYGIEVKFDHEGRVAAHSLYGVEEPDAGPSVLERLHAWLGW
jgi:hypothetical protein